MRNAQKKRIGLILESIHTGSALNVWSSFAQKAVAENMSLFVFPGGKLNSTDDLSMFRNPIFSLANGQNLDGIISWSSSIGSTMPDEEFRAFHSGFDPLPYVTIGHKIACHPCVEFDAYNGMKSLVTHFISKHQSQRIAFLRGPETHSSARDRFNGYRDALICAGLPYDENLVSSPFGWSNGGAAIAQLVEDRALVPGSDFDTLIGSSDMMIFPAIEYLDKRRYSVPGDYRAGGFNNSAESKILDHPLSTVRMPYAELSGESFKILRQLLYQQKETEIPDVMLPCEVVIRESCGCKETGVPNIAEVDADVFATPLIISLMADDKALFFALVKKTFSRFLDTGRDIDSFLDLIQYVHNSLATANELKDSATANELKYIEKFSSIESELYRIIARMQEHSHTFSTHKHEKWHSALNSLKCELLGTRDRTSLVQSLARHLPKIGIFTASVMLYMDENTTECIGSFSPEGINAESGRQFSSKQLFPLELTAQYADGIFMVQPLFIENRPLGYFITNVPFYDGVILEELRSSVSNALKGIFMFEGASVRTVSDTRTQSDGKGVLFCIGVDGGLFPSWDLRAVRVSSSEDFAAAVARDAPALVALGTFNMEAIQMIRSHPATVMTPVIVVPEQITSADDVNALCAMPRVLLCNRSVANSAEFSRRIQAVASGEPVLPVYTGALVKKALLYFNHHFGTHISRWRLADSANVSEDYLTRIFRHEMGFSLWEYLNQYRIYLAADLLLHTGKTITDVARSVGFHDHAYFCRVFKKVYGKAPSQLRRQ
jgi:DNA-binding LacI/PurR family transcriptional regulator/AraC-like DNA-binding protein